MELAAGEFSRPERPEVPAAATRMSNRSDIYLAVASLFRTQSARISHRERALMCDILSRLARHTDPSVRATIAESLADDPEAPRELVLLLAKDAIEVARPLILRSEPLTDGDLLELIVGASEAHKVACAERPRISEAVADALAETKLPSVLQALRTNRTVRASAKMLGLMASRSPSAEPSRRALEPTETPKPVIAERLSGSLAKPSVTMLVDKLSAAGQLRAGFLLRVLQQRQFELFDLAFARLLELELPEFRRMFYAEGPRPVALACRAVGIDRSVFSTVFDLSRAGQKARAFLTPDQRSDVEDAFARFSKIEAKARLKGDLQPETVIRG